MQRSRSVIPSDIIQLGVAARLVPVKGVALVLHALQTLSASGMNVKLQVAGAGPEQPRLEALARKLDIAERCTFHGTVADMRQFYTNIDCLLHPPVTEAFGLVAIEAAAHGCPVIAAAVDGLPEAVEEGLSGSCIQPTLPLAEYRKLGGSFEGLPAEVYDRRDRRAARAARRRSDHARRSRPSLVRRPRAIRTLEPIRERARRTALRLRRARRAGDERGRRARRVYAVKLLMYRRSIDIASGTGQLMLMQARALQGRGRRCHARL